MTWLATVGPDNPNRSVRAGWVRHFREIMESGEFFDDSAQACISIDENGNLLDGQHRLTAVVQGGKPVSMCVQYGVPRERMRYLGVVMARKKSDDILIEFPELKGAERNAATAAGLLIQHKRGLTYKGVHGSGSFGTAPIGPERIDFIADHDDIKPIIWDTKDYKSGGIIAAVAYLFPDADIHECARITNSYTSEHAREKFAKVYQFMSVDYEARSL
jgi:hypothetical protein